MEDCQFKLKAHDRFQVEMKFSYALAAEKTRSQFRVETFLFIPPSLGIFSRTYNQDQFFQDLQVYTRYATPNISLAELLDPNEERSSLLRLERLPNRKGELTSAEISKWAVFELRILICIIRARILDAGRSIRTKLRSSVAGTEFHKEDFESARLECEAFLDTTGQIVERLRAVKRVFLGPNQEPEILNAFELAEEAFSVYVEETCAKLYRAMGKIADHPNSESVRSSITSVAHALVKKMDDESARRLRACYPSQVDVSGTPSGERANEYYLHRTSVLKKFGQSILFLAIHSGRGSKPVHYSINAVAAMAAMLFNLILIIILVPNQQSLSLSAIVLLVIAYGFKDRIKDSLKAYFNERMTGVLKDRENKLQDRGVTGAVVGETAEGFSFVSIEHLSKDILNLRARREFALLAEEGPPENVIKYQRDITLHPNRINKIHRRIDCVDEIIRFNVRSFLSRMDEPRKRLVILKSQPTIPLAQENADLPARDQESNLLDLAKSYKTQFVSKAIPSLPPLKQVRAAKVYHVNMLFRISSKNEQDGWDSKLFKYRLILSRDGIKRIEAETDGGMEVLKPPRA